jgi:zinc-binding alcohol dehydrogenase family protein
MRAVVFTKNLPTDDPNCFIEVDVPRPKPKGSDLLVRVKAVSVNPADVQMRANRAPQQGGTILGFDAAGIVEEVGENVSRFRPGDEVYYAGNMRRAGSNAEFQLVDEHIVGHKPTSLSMTDAAALPLTTITAWEALFDHLALTESSEGTLVAVGAAGGVGSMITQLAKARTRLQVIATASRDDSARWATSMGADLVVDHHKGLADQVLKLVPGGADYVFSPYSKSNVREYAKLLRVGGHVVAIDSVGDIGPLKMKSIAWHWELMFSRPIYAPHDDYQHVLLESAAAMVDQGILRSTATVTLGPLSAETLREAHRQVETSSTIGKVVLPVE